MLDTYLWSAWHTMWNVSLLQTTSNNIILPLSSATIHKYLEQQCAEILQLSCGGSGWDHAGSRNKSSVQNYAQISSMTSIHHFQLCLHCSFHYTCILIGTISLINQLWRRVHKNLLSVPKLFTTRISGALCAPSF